VTGALLDLQPLRTSGVFRRLWIGGCCSGFGSQMTLVAIMFQVWQATHSTVWSGAVGIAQAIPLVAIGLVAGSLVDRYDRRTIYLLARCGQLATAIALAVQGLAGQLPVLGLLAVLAGQSCFVAVSGPASRTFISRLLPTEQVSAGLALNRISSQAAMLIGPAVGGLVLGAAGVGGCYLIDALSFGAAFYGALGLPAMRPDGAGARPGIHGVLDGFAFMGRNPVIRGALLTDLAATVLSFPISLFPLINAERFGNNPRTLGLFLSAIAVGGVLASIFAGSYTRRGRQGLVMVLAAGGWGAALVGFALAPGAWLGLGFLVLAGFADTVSVVSRGTLVQTHTPDALRGRVVAAEIVVGRAGPDIGNLRGGLLASATSGTVSLLSGGLLCLLGVAAVALTTPELVSGEPVPA
jgi:MFS family permease